MYKERETKEKEYPSKRDKIEKGKKEKERGKDTKKKIER